MNWLEFFSSIVSSLAWPTAILALAWTFRAQVRELLNKLKDVELLGGKATFGNELKQAEDKAAQIPPPVDSDNVNHEPDKSGQTDAMISEDYLQLAEKFPQAAILQAWQWVESVFNEYAEQYYRATAVEIFAILRREGFIEEDVYDLYKRIRYTRNIAVHNLEPVTTGEAIAYRELCDKLRLHLAIALERRSRVLDRALHQQKVETQ